MENCKYCGQPNNKDYNLTKAAPAMYEALKQALELCDLRESGTQDLVEAAIKAAEGRE